MKAIKETIGDEKKDWKQRTDSVSKILNIKVYLHYIYSISDKSVNTN